MKKKICMILVAVFVAVLGTSTYFIIDHYKESDKQAELYGKLADLVNAAAQTNAATEATKQILYSEEKMLLPELAELYQQNGDLVGWISIADTNINYPVMQSVNEPNFYLKHGFDKEYSDYGCPYVQEDCDVQEPSDNLVIYGHYILSDIFWKMNSISSRSESHSETEITETDDGNGNIVQTGTTVTKTTLYITVSHLTVEEMADLYGFNEEQREYLAELLKDENNSLWAAVLYGIRYSEDSVPF